MVTDMIFEYLKARAEFLNEEFDIDSGSSSGDE